MNKNMLSFSIIVPVYNRPQEMHEFLDSLRKQTDHNFEVVIMEGQCDRTCRLICQSFSNLDLRFESRNTSRSARRNEGMALAKGNYFLFFDSDVILPPNYIETVRQKLTEDYVDCYGGPDSADESFNTLQRSINYAMTSFLTTGGIRGKVKDVSKYKPRAFNMGFSREVFLKVKGYKEMIGEDVDLSMRIAEAGFSVKLIPEAVVFHKRRVTFFKFIRQVNTFGKARILLSALHPNSFKIMHAFPTVFLLGSILLALLALLFQSWLWLAPLALYALMLFIESLVVNRSLGIALLSIFTSFGQLWGYGAGFLDESLTRRASKKNAETLYRQ